MKIKIIGFIGVVIVFSWLYYAAKVIKSRDVFDISNWHEAKEINSDNECWQAFSLGKSTIFTFTYPVSELSSDIKSTFRPRYQVRKYASYNHLKVLDWKLENDSNIHIEECIRHHKDHSALYFLTAYTNQEETIVQADVRRLNASDELLRKLMLNTLKHIQNNLNKYPYSDMKLASVSEVAVPENYWKTVRCDGCDYIIPEKWAPIGVNCAGCDMAETKKYENMLFLAINDDLPYDQTYSIDVSCASKEAMPEIYARIHKRYLKHISEYKTKQRQLSPSLFTVREVVATDSPRHGNRVQSDTVRWYADDGKIALFVRTNIPTQISSELYDKAVLAITNQLIKLK